MAKSSLLTKIRSIVPSIFGGDSALKTVSGLSPFYGRLDEGIRPGEFSFPDYMNLTDNIFSVSSDQEIIKAVTDCPQIGAILHSKSNAYVNGIVEVLSKSTRNKVKGQDKRWQTLMEHPNVLQNGEAFRAQLKFYIMAFGYCPVLRVIPEGYEFGTEISALWVLPPHSTEIKFKKGNMMYTDNISNLIESVTLRKDNVKYTIKKEDVYIFTDTTPLRDNSYLPCSRVSSLQFPINNIIKSYKTEGRIISKPLGILANQARDTISTLPIGSKERRELHRAFKSYGTSDGQEDTIITDATLKWEHMMYPVSELQMVELRTANAAILCDGMGYPFDLFGKDKGTTFTNGASAGKTLYQNFIIPESKNMDTQFNECLYGDINGVEYVTCFDHVAALQDDIKARAEVRKLNIEAATLEFNSNGITYNQFLVSIGYHEVSEPYSDMYAWQIRQDYPEFFNNTSNGTSNTTTQGSGTATNEATVTGNQTSSGTQTQSTQGA